MRFDLEEKDHAAARMLRAETGKSNQELWLDMSRVYKKHPKEWAKNSPAKA